MKKLCFLFALCCSIQLHADTSIFNFDAPTGIVVSGSGSGIGAVSPEELEAWDVLYATVNQDTLASRLQKSVHRFYIARKGLNIGWKFFESQILQAIADENLPVTPAASEMEAWDNLYRVASTQNLRWLIRYKDHKKYVRDKGWENIYIRYEENYIGVIKQKLNDS